MFPPASNEYPNSRYFAEYLNFNPKDQLKEILKNNELSILQLFENYQEVELMFRYESNKWSLKELIGHLTDTEKIFCYRALAIARGETTSLPSFDENQYVQNAQFDRLSANQLIQYYFATRTATLAFIDTLREEQWMTMGTANGHSISCRALLWMIAGHEKHHVHMINERYLPLLDKK